MYNSLQLNKIQQLAEVVTEENIEAWLDYLKLARNENGHSAPKDISDRTSIKVYVHKDHRQLLNDYCSITGISVSELIRRLTLEHIKEEVERYTPLQSKPIASAISTNDTP